MSSSSEEEDREAICPMDFKGLVKILEALMLNTASIRKKLKISTTRDPTQEILNADTAKQLKSIKHWLEKYSKENTRTQQKITVATQMTLNKME